jgi:uncharacterized protein YjbI with pentapeptide repeats
MDACLKDAIFVGTHLERAQILRVHCESANFTEACFNGAPPRIDVATLLGISMGGANLSQTRLRRVDPSRVYGLTRAQVGHAMTDDETVLPDISMKTLAYDAVMRQ